MPDERMEFKREMDRRMIDTIIRSANVKDDLDKLRQEVHDLRIENQVRDDALGRKIDEKMETMTATYHGLALANARIHTRLQIYVAVIASLLLLWMSHVSDKLFK